MSDEINKKEEFDRRELDITYSDRRQTELIGGKQDKAWGCVLMVLSPVLGIILPRLTHKPIGWLVFCVSFLIGAILYITGRIRIWSAGK